MFVLVKTTCRWHAVVRCRCRWFYALSASHREIFIKSPRGGGAFEILDLFLHVLDLLKKIVDLSVCRRVQRSRYLTKHSKTV